ncbi:MAG: glycosyltransferase family 2 protein [Anaerolineae bacterium]
MRESLLIDHNTIKISVLVPARNEEGNVTLVIDKIAKAFAAHDLQGEVIFVNDGSTDGTQQEAEACARRYPFVKVINHRRNLGVTEALRTGFRHISGDVVILLPGDMESDPEEDIPKLLDKLAEGYDVVAGWRQGRHDGKVFASRIYNFVSRLLFGLKLHDMNWIKAFRREVVENLHLRSDWHRFILMIAASQGYRIGEVKTNYYPRRQGRSKFGLSRIPVSFLDVLVVKFLLTFSRKPMLFFGSLGLILISIAIIIGLFLLYLWFAYYMQKRPVLLSAGVLALAGLLLFLVGFLAELVVNQQERVEDLERAIRELDERLRGS